MEYRSLGRTGVQVSPLCLGAMNFGGPTEEKASVAMIDRALDGGINFIDTANVYNAGESERIVGKALERNGRRDRVVLATKVHGAMGEGPNDQGNSRYHIMHACEESLRRLRTDRIDLYQVHRPSLTIPQDETLRALDDLVRAGKVRYVGCSTYPAWMVMEGLAISERMGIVRTICEQPPYNLLDRRAENELIPLCQKYGLAVIPWSPLAGGVLTGRYTPAMLESARFPDDSRAARWDGMLRRITRRGLEVAAAVAEMAGARGLSCAQLALLWVKDQPGVTAPIVGPRTMDHLEAALGVLDLALDEADRPLFDALVHPGSAVADFHNSNPWMKARLGDEVS